MSSSTPIGIRAGRGRRDPSLLARREDPASPTGPVPVYVTARPLKHGVYVVPPGVELLGAHAWPRIATMVDTRRVRAAELDEAYERWEDFEARALAAGTTDPGERPWKRAADLDVDAVLAEVDDDDPGTVGERTGQTEVRDPVLPKGDPRRKARP